MSGWGIVWGLCLLGNGRNREGGGLRIGLTRITMSKDWKSIKREERKRGT